jgi:hypothetical protein
VSDIELIRMSSDLLVELDEKEKLETCQVDADALVRFHFCHIHSCCFLSVIVDLK